MELDTDVEICKDGLTSGDQKKGSIDIFIFDQGRNEKFKAGENSAHYTTETAWQPEQQSNG